MSTDPARPARPARPADPGTPASPAAPADRPWAADTAYRPGDLVTFGGAPYQCLQAHTSATGWEPSAVPALWRRL